jgi:membrane protease YdiL (CAAX protease family)
MFLLSATPWSKFPGGEETARQLMAEHAWFFIFQGLLGLGSVFLNVCLIGVAMAYGRTLLRSRLASPPWSFREAVRLMSMFGAVYFGIFILNSVIRFELGDLLARHGFGENHLLIVGLSVTQLITLVLIAQFAIAVRRHSGTTVGAYWRGSDVKRAAWGVPLFVLVLVPVGILFWGTELLLHELGVSVDPQPLVMRLWETGSVWFVVLVSAFAVFVAPLVEETLFRGILYPTLRARWGMWPAILINSFVFALLHFHLPTLIPLMGLAVLLSLAFEVTGSLPVCIVAHGLFNGTSLALIWLLRSAAPAG